MKGSSGMAEAKPLKEKIPVEFGSTGRSMVCNYSRVEKNLMVRTIWLV